MEWPASADLEHNTAMVPLSPATVLHIEKLFRPEDRDAAESLLRDECAENLPLCEGTDPIKSERIRFAVLKLSQGKLDGLLKWIEAAQVDWRDVLMAAGFAHSVDVHEDWDPRSPSGPGYPESTQTRRSSPRGSS